MFAILRNILDFYVIWKKQAGMRAVKILECDATQYEAATCVHKSSHSRSILADLYLLGKSDSVELAACLRSKLSNKETLHVVSWLLLRIITQIQKKVRKYYAKDGFFLFLPRWDGFQFHLKISIEHKYTRLLLFVHDASSYYTRLSFLFFFVIVNKSGAHSDSFGKFVGKARF